MRINNWQQMFYAEGDAVGGGAPDPDSVTPAADSDSASDPPDYQKQWKNVHGKGEAAARKKFIKFLSGLDDMADDELEDVGKNVFRDDWEAVKGRFTRPAPDGGKGKRVDDARVETLQAELKKAREESKADRDKAQAEIRGIRIDDAVGKAVAKEAKRLSSTEAAELLYRKYRDFQIEDGVRVIPIAKDGSPLLDKDGREHTVESDFTQFLNTHAAAAGLLSAGGAMGGGSGVNGQRPSGGRVNLNQIHSTEEYNRLKREGKIDVGSIVAGGFQH